MINNRACWCLSFVKYHSLFPWNNKYNPYVYHWSAPDFHICTCCLNLQHYCTAPLRPLGCFLRLCFGQKLQPLKTLTTAQEVVERSASGTEEQEKNCQRFGERCAIVMPLWQAAQPSVSCKLHFFLIFRKAPCLLRNHRFLFECVLALLLLLCVVSIAAACDSNPGTFFFVSLHFCVFSLFCKNGKNAVLSVAIVSGEWLHPRAAVYTWSYTTMHSVPCHSPSASPLPAHPSSYSRNKMQPKRNLTINSNTIPWAASWKLSSLLHNISTINAASSCTATEKPEERRKEK